MSQLTFIEYLVNENYLSMSKKKTCNSYLPNVQNGISKMERGCSEATRENICKVKEKVSKQGWAYCILLILPPTYLSNLAASLHPHCH